MTAPKYGDRVRVEYDAEYRHAEAGRHIVSYDLPDYPDHWASLPPGATLTVIAPAAKVGDVVTVDDLDRLPVGAVLVPIRRGAAVGVLTSTGWLLANDGSTLCVPSTPATVVALRGDPT